MVKVIEAGGMSRGEFLETSHASEVKHCALPSSKWLVRILCAIVCPPGRLLPIADAQLPSCGFVGREAVGHNLFDMAIPFSRFPDGFQSCLLSSLLVPVPCHVAFEHLTIVVDGVPKIVSFAIGLHDDLVEVSVPAARPHSLNPSLADLSAEHLAKPAPPKRHCLVAEVDALLVQ